MVLDMGVWKEEEWNWTEIGGVKVLDVVQASRFRSSIMSVEN